MRAIDADDLYGIIKLMDTDVIRASKEARFLLGQVLFDIEHTPTIDAVAVAHGMWERMENPYGELEGFIHIKCGHQSQSATNYCSNCGFKMDADETND